MSIALRSIPHPPVRSIPRRTALTLALLLLVFVAMPSVVRALELVWSPTTAALAGQIIEAALGIVIAAWAFRLVRGYNALARRHAGELEHLTEADALTGLGNQRALYRELEETFNRARRTQEPVTVIYADVEGLDELNRRHGRATGDQTLRTIGAVVRSSVRFGVDAGYRVTEDEFALRVSADRDSVAAVCRRLAWTFGDRTGGRSRLHIGVATWDGRASAERLVAEARRALDVQRRALLTPEMA